MFRIRTSILVFVVLFTPARVSVAWYALREIFEEKTEAMAGEPMDILTHIAPQLAALA
jgi:hypothetical protein